MSKVDIGELKELLASEPEIAATMAYANKLILSPNNRLGDYVGIVMLGPDWVTAEIIISKKELVRFAKDVLEMAAI